MDQPFDRTTGQVARDAGVSPPTVRLYASRGWLPHITASDGTRLFGPDAAESVRRICLERMQRRGVRSAAGAFSSEAA